MTSKASTPDQYVKELPAERKESFSKLRETILKNLPKGFEECMNYGMIGYVVPHSIYPPGYHCDPKMPLPFVGLANQKGAITFYHMALYGDTELMTWFQEEFPKHSKQKLDMGKSCVRFKKVDDIPYQLIGTLMKKIKPKDWIAFYESHFKR